MKTGETDIDDRKLVNHLSGANEWGQCIGFWTTTYEFQRHFFETDFLPTMLSLGAWDDRHWTSRIAMEHKLSLMDGGSIMLDARSYDGRPRSLRIDTIPAMAPGGAKLHAKVSLFVYEQAVHLMVGSANLTEPGYRRNIEVASNIVVTEKDISSAPLIRSAIQKAPNILAQWWRESADAVNQQALKWIENFNVKNISEAEWFAWSGAGQPFLWRQFIDKWPKNERIDSITISSPFWSEEDGQGPLVSLIQYLKKERLLGKNITIHLITDGQAVSETEWKPVLPASYGKFDFKGLGVDAFVYRSDPTVTKQEVIQEGFADLRKLHAKVALFEGVSFSQAYMGSANFTRKGWGFLTNAQSANIEAGVIIQRKNNKPLKLKSVLPRTTGQAIRLTGDNANQISEPVMIEEAPKWPMFIDGIYLMQSNRNAEELVFSVKLKSDQINGAWGIRFAPSDKSEQTIVIISGNTHDTSSQYFVELSKDDLYRLLKDQEVLIFWWANMDGVPYPINIASAAKMELPINPDAGKPNENMLLAYYQGRIAYEELFPPEDDYPMGLHGKEYSVDESGVDTTNIQSYQIREFVESLEGMRQDLKRASVSCRAMRSAIRGPVSPLALARLVKERVDTGKRTPTAAAFQLVEIINCLGETTTWENHAEWSDVVDATTGEIINVLDKIVFSFPGELGPKSRFAMYRRQLINR